VQVLHLLQLGQTGAVDDIGWVYQYYGGGLELFTYRFGPHLRRVYIPSLRPPTLSTPSLHASPCCIDVPVQSGVMGKGGSFFTQGPHRMNG